MPGLTATAVRPAHRRRRSSRVLVAAAVVAALLLTACLAAYATGVRVVTVTSTSMEPTLRPGDRMLTRPVDGADVRPGDLVVFTPSTQWWDAYERTTGLPAGDHMVKRVVATGGDVVECCAADGNLLRNGERLEEPWLAEDPGSLNTVTFRVTVPQDGLWLLGDNRRTSFDSRAVQAISGDGAVPVSAVTALVLRSW